MGRGGVPAVAVAALLGGLLLGLVPAAASAGPVSGSDYVARLEAARKLAEADAAHPSPQEMDAVRRAVGLPLDVAVGATVVHVGVDDTLAGLKGTRPEDFRHAGDQLGALEDSARAALIAQPPDAQRLQAALRQAFQGVSTRPSLIERLRHDIWLVLLSIWQRLTGAANHLPVPNGVVLVIVVALVGGVLVVLIRRMRYVVPDRAARARSQTKRARPDWERLAEEALARGDLPGAVRARYGALLAALASRGVVPDIPSLTAGECRRAVAGDLPGVYPVVARATSIFEGVMYGREPVTRAEVDTMAEAQQSVKAA